MLLLHADRIVPVDRLIDDLWGEDVPRTAQTNSRDLHSRNVSRARPLTRVSERRRGEEPYCKHRRDATSFMSWSFPALRLDALGRIAISCGGASG